MNPYKKPFLIAIVLLICAAGFGILLDWPWASSYMAGVEFIRGIATLLGYGVFGAGLWVFSLGLFKRSITRGSYESLAVSALGLTIAYQGVYGLLCIALLLAWIELRVRFGIASDKISDSDKIV